MPRIAIVRKEDCHPVKCGDLCIKLCPSNRMGQDCITKSDGKAYIDESLCTGCGICTKRCPFGAIDIINLPKELDKEPIHQYGRNGFHLYSLPTPLFGKVVGILGKNGIGKSTALKILAGILKPNLGKWDRKDEASHEDIIKYFKGTEAQLFFEKLSRGEITVAYKPQAVDLVARNTKGKVKDLLEKVDEKGIYDDMVAKLDLGKILDSDVSKISGGEMQRVAIAATMMKKANVYFFDEPTSYLDIKQRIKISKLIRELADENTSVMVVEHDLIILDHMTDLVHIIYGKETAYGVVSMPKSTKGGINVYLSGYLKDENMRFRDHAIKFMARPPVVDAEKPVVASWKGLSKTLGNFHLCSPEGMIRRGNVVGILGENGIGKTSFVKLLAGVDKPDEGEIEEEVTVSYKPQYLEGDSEELVSELLHEAISKYDVQLIKPLLIDPLLNRKLNELSGGELQRVAICLCLSKDAKLFLLDEPSAHLDVEQRLHMSRIIRDFMDQKGTSALIVDHDLLLIDYVSHKLMVFDGEPAVKGEAKGPFPMSEGMTKFLKELNITFRRDEESLRPRVNKSESVKDREQRAKGNYYYV